MAETIETGLGADGVRALESLADPSAEPSDRIPVLPRLYDVSYHYDAAGEQQLAARYALLAAEQARRQFALEVAAGQYAIASRNRECQPRNFSYRLSKGWGETLMLRGQYEDAAAEFQIAFDAGGTELEKASISLLRVENSFKHGVLSDSIAHGRDVLQRLGFWIPESISEFCVGIVHQILVQLWQTLRPRKLHRLPPTGDAECAILTFVHLGPSYGFMSTPPFIWSTQVAINLAERVRATPALSHAQAMHGCLLSTIGWHGRSSRYFDQAIRVSDELHDAWGHGIVLNFRGMSRWAAGHYEEGLKYLKEGIEAFARMGDFWYLNFSRFHAACCYYAMGDLAAAITEARETFACSTRIGDTRSNCSLYVWAKAMQGQLPFDELQSCCALATDDVLCTCNRTMAEGHWHLGAGRTNEAIEAFERVIQLCKKHRLLNFHPIDALPWLLHALRRRAEELRETDRAKSQRLLKRAYRFGKRAAWITRFFPTSYPSTLRELALVYADRGQLRKALRLIDKSLAVAKKQSAKYEQAQSAAVHSQLARKLGLDGADDEIQRAEATLVSIRDAARKAATAPLT